MGAEEEKKIFTKDCSIGHLSKQINREGKNVVIHQG
jgi:hypothetical protein